MKEEQYLDLMNKLLDQIDFKTNDLKSIRLRLDLTGRCVSQKKSYIINRNHLDPTLPILTDEDYLIKENDINKLISEEERGY